MVGRVHWWVLLLLLAPVAAGGQDPAVQEGPRVNAVLFYSPSCPHCREVMTQALPPILERYGDRLQVVSVNTATTGGQQLYRAAVESLPIPEERIGVPALIVGSQLLVGSYEIPNQLPAIVDAALADAGIDWPPVPLIRRALAAQGLTVSPDSATPTEPASELAADSQAEPEPAEQPEPGRPDSQPPPPDSQRSREEADSAAPAVESPEAEEDTAEPGAGETGAAETVERTASGSEPAGADTGEPGAERDAAAGEPGAGGDTEPVEPPPADRDSAAVTPAGETEPGADRETTSDVDVGAAEEAALDSLLAGAIDPDARAALVHQIPVRERLMLDPEGNGFAIAVLILMLVVLALVVADAAGRLRIPPPPEWAIPVLAVVGIGVASYLAFVEVTGSEAVCGPVGDCNTVQQSPYATIVGVPVGLLGVVGYAVLMATWLLGRLASGREARLARSAVWWMALGATGFSIYLTFLEPFVIGASCAWCLTSAVATTLILAAATPERRDALEARVEPEQPMAAASGR